MQSQRVEILVLGIVVEEAPGVGEKWSLPGWQLCIFPMCVFLAIGLYSTLFYVNFIFYNDCKVDQAGKE